MAMQIAEREAAPVQRSWWDERPIEGIPLSREQLAWMALIGVALLLRVWDLGSKMLHHDESLHATYSWYYYVGKGYRHDPMMHGPWQFTIMAFSYFLFGASEVAARLPHAMFGTIIVGLCYLMRGYMGRLGAFIAGVFLCLSPSFLYFSRFAREDIFAVTWTMLIVVAAFRWYAERRTVWLYVLSAAICLAFATKENVYITIGIVVLFFIVSSLVGESRSELPGLIVRRENGRLEWLRIFDFDARTLSAPAQLAVFIATLFVPLFAGFAELPYMLVVKQTTSALDVFLVVVLLVLGLIGGLIGYRAFGRTWLVAAGIFWGIFAVLFTSFFSNPAGLDTGALGGLRYWIEQQGVARGDQPWYYYLLLLPLYEFVVIAFGIVGIVYYSRKRNYFAYFLMWWIALSQVIYTYTSEKMPWLAVHLTLPFALLAGMTVARIVEGVDWRAVSRRWTGFLFAASLALAVAAAFGLTGKQVPSLQDIGTLTAQQALYDFLVNALVVVILIVLAVRFGRDLGRRLSGRLGALTALGLMMIFSIHTAWQDVYYHSDIPVEMNVYVQTTRDVGTVMNEIQTIGNRTGQGMNLQVAYDSGVSWPFEWYLRDYNSRYFFGNGLPPADAPVVLVGFDNDNEARVAQYLGTNYVAQRYELRAWFDESDYRALQTDPGLLVQAITDPAKREKLWQFLLYRTPLKPAGSTDFVMFVRKDLAYGAWAAPQTAAAAPAASADAYAAAARQVSAESTIGATAPSPLASPRNLAVAPDGSIYVLDTGNDRVVHFDASGKLLGAWGSKGSEQSQFNEPWGIAVDQQGKVYVADTWNHRIEVFDGSGKLVSILGSANDLYGPRGVAITPEGQVLVTDAGNHRVVVFSQDGSIQTTFGSRGTGQGQFQEPVGIAVGNDGNIYVADTWNKRIQEFDANFKPVTMWTISGWASQSLAEKPYLAVDASGNVYATDPEKSRVIEFGSGGQLIAVFGQSGAGASGLTLPTGIAVDEQGNILVADVGNSRIQVFAPIQ